MLFCSDHDLLLEWVSSWIWLELSASWAEDLFVDVKLLAGLIKCSSHRLMNWASWQLISRLPLIGLSIVLVCIHLICIVWVLASSFADLGYELVFDRALHYHSLLTNREVFYVVFDCVFSGVTFIVIHLNSSLHLFMLCINHFRLSI
mgnify:CR=1 FL=1